MNRKIGIDKKAFVHTEQSKLVKTFCAANFLKKSFFEIRRIMISIIFRSQFLSLLKMTMRENSKSLGVKISNHHISFNNKRFLIAVAGINNTLR